MPEVLEEEIIIKPTGQNQPEPTRKPQRKKSFSGYELFRNNVLYLLMFFAIALLYIRNAHYSEGLVRTIDKTKSELKEIRWEYMTTKAELMHASKQTEVARIVQPSGLKELTDPPKKIKIAKDEH